MGLVTHENLFSEPRKNIVDLISSKVSDPISSSSEHRKWIYSRVPDIKAGSFAGYPIIIIHPSSFYSEKEESSANGKVKFVSWELDIEIITSDRGSGDNDGKGLIYIDLISNEIISVLLNVSNRAMLRSYGMSSEEPVTSEVIAEALKEEMTYRRVLTVNFRNRRKISA